MRFLAPLLVAVIFTLPVSGPAHADHPDEKGNYSILLENDAFTGTDRHYTQGTRLSWLSAEDHLPTYGR